MGDIKEIMLDVLAGRISYAVLSFGGVFGVGEKLFAVPWAALTLEISCRGGKKRPTLAESASAIWLQSQERSLKSNFQGKIKWLPYQRADVL